MADKVFKAKLALKEGGRATYQLPANQEECDAYIQGRSIGLTGREIEITSASPEYLTERHEYEFIATEFGILVEELSEDESKAYVESMKIHDDIMPDIENAITAEHIDRFLFNHPSEPAIEAVLVKHGYIKHHDAHDLKKVIGATTTTEQGKSGSPANQPADSSASTGADQQSGTTAKEQDFTAANVSANTKPEPQAKPARPNV